ncbi:MAG: hypothetical protein JOZ05_25730, partial [Acetobacteraceae bacterium]|nr:hypothetical protein [Acetobacteraceae bacterium]
PDLADRLAALHDSTETYDERTQPALDVIERDYTAERFVRALVELALEVRAATAFVPFDPQGKD